MKLMQLFKNPAKQASLVPVDLSSLKVGDEMVDTRNNEHVKVVGVTRAKVTYMAKRGQYSMLPSDFARVFCVEKEHTEG